ncbi:MAG TPA: hypothetical protein VF988_14160 [Verrucomicrobiae bacterium]
MNRRSAASTSAPNHCRALVRVDGTEIRKKIKKAYAKALRDLEKSRRVLEQFHQSDQPQFMRWFNSHFGALLTELRDLGQKLSANEATIFLVENEVLFGDSSHARAYQRVTQLQNNPEPPPGDDPFAGEHNADRPGSAPKSGREWEQPEPDAEDDPMTAFFDELFGEPGPDNNPYGPGNFAPWGLPPQASPPPPVRLKEVYRAVVRRLHPDSGGKMTAQMTEWWHQAQAAYETGDVEQLEVILTFCEMGESGPSTHTSASYLQRATAQLKRSLREIKRQITQLRREPAWNFSLRTDHATMVENVQRTLATELQEIRFRWEETEQIIAEWKAAADKLKPRKRRKAPVDEQPLLWRQRD